MLKGSNYYKATASIIDRLQKQHFFAWRLTMASKIKDFYRGDTKRWAINWPVDITGATIKFMMSLDTNVVPDLTVQAELMDPVGGEILGAYVEITETMSAALEPGRYTVEHEITLAGGDVGTFGRQTLRVIKDLG